VAEVGFDLLPDSARVWIYGSRRKIEHGEVQALDRHMADFLEEWRSHGREITPAWTLAYDRFVVIAADESATGLSGCSIDSMFRAVMALGFSNSGNDLYYRSGDGEILYADRLEFRGLVETGRVDRSTIVFNNTVATVGEFRRGSWEVPMRESWHMEAFGPLIGLRESSAR
jgi:hypothetical protein